MENGKIVYVGANEYVFAPTLTVEDIRTQLMQVHPEIDRAVASVDSTSGSITFMTEAGEKGC